MTEAEATYSESTGGSSNFILFLIAAVVVVAITSLAVVHMPDQFKKIFLLSVAYCVVVAVALRMIVANLLLSVSRWLTFAIYGLLIGGQVLIAWQSYQLLLADRRAALKDEPLAELALEISKSEDGDSDHSRQFRETMNPSFPYYLRYRLSRVANLTQPWPSIIWGMEILLSAIIGVLVGKQVVPFGTNPEQPSEPIQ